MLEGEPPTPDGQSPVTKDADTSPAPRPTSVRQIEANRKNALHSTGPKTPEGKQASRLNALKHGLRAKEVIIPGQEDPAEFEAILTALREDWEPKGHTELHLVEQIGLAEWRLRRIHRAELGEIRSQMSNAMQSDVEIDIEKEFEDWGEELPQRLRKSSAGISYQWDAIEDALAELESQGTVSDDTCIYLEMVFGMGKYTPASAVRVLLFREMPDGKKDLKTDGKPTPTVAEREAARKLLEFTLKDLEREERKLRKQERTNLEIIRQRMSIPQARVLERIQRYETSIKRDMYRAIEQLERLQRRRRGEPPPPTVNVNVLSQDGD